MIVLICVDDNGGVMFNHRRQSQDRVLRCRVLEKSKGHALWMRPYSLTQFEGAGQRQIFVDEAYLMKAKLGDYCFVEGTPLADCEQRIEKLIIYKWNRIYPADRWFDLNLGDNCWNLISSYDFTGSSHERITEEVYTR